MSTGCLHVVAAAIGNAQGDYLIARRAASAHQGGKWEFPGGKVEPGEDARAALSRELNEELGIRPILSRPLIRIHHAYPDKSVLLDVWHVQSYSGEAYAREGQPLAWVAANALQTYDFPEANRPIITALNLPSHYLITPEPGADRKAYLSTLRDRLQQGIVLLQLRAHTLDPPAYAELAGEVLRLCRQYGARLLLNADPAQAVHLAADGVHLSARRLHQLQARPLPDHALLGASCHTLADLQQAQRVGCDFAVLSPVQATQTHAQAEPLGWPAFSALCEHATLPVYALGGLSPAHTQIAQQAGAQGVAAIRGLWAAPL